MQCVIVCSSETDNVNLNASNMPPEFIQTWDMAGVPARMSANRRDASRRPWRSFGAPGAARTASGGVGTAQASLPTVPPPVPRRRMTKSLRSHSPSPV